MNYYFKTLKHILEGDNNITFLSGAVISTSCGLPDFRSDKNSFWKKNKPIHFSDFKASKESRVKSWENNIAIQQKIKGAESSNMHKCVNKLLKINKKNFHITQNIDGLHKIEDGNADQVVELHGNIFNAYCLNCGQTFETESFFNLNVKTTGDSICPSCKKGYVKVGTISFGQKLKTSVISSAKIASENCDYFIVMGSSLKVSPANSMLRIAKNNGAEVIILNKDPTPFDSEASIIINGDLEKIYNEIR